MTKDAPSLRVSGYGRYVSIGHTESKLRELPHSFSWMMQDSIHQEHCRTTFCKSHGETSVAHCWRLRFNLPRLPLARPFGDFGFSGYLYCPLGGVPYYSRKGPKTLVLIVKAPIRWSFARIPIVVQYMFSSGFKGPRRVRRSYLVLTGSRVQKTRNDEMYLKAL